ncbi:uncharacterized protein LOC134102456 [Sardina pilchardus]|uniref:uncharacterized protein LOC134102456 n=1 Tax=Sardina pilchardus TaxID=27697 RepID=UPI002E159100
MPSCAARNCTSLSTLEGCKGVRLHRFPLKQNDRLQLWLQRIGRPDWTPKAGSRLCSIHFEEDCFYTTPDGRVHLKDTAVPSISSPSESLRKKKTKGRKKRRQVKTHDQGCQTDLADHTYCRTQAVPDPVHHSHTVVPAPSDVAVGALSQNDGSEMQGGWDHCNTENAWEELAHLQIKVIKVEDLPEIDDNTAEEQGLEQPSSDRVEHDHCYLHSGISSGSADHSYMVADSPRTLKRKLDAAQRKLQQCRKRIKLQGETINRLKRKVTSLSAVILELKQKSLISSECAEVLEGSISGVPWEVLFRVSRNKKSHRISNELRTFANALHFYSAKAYEYVCQSFNLVLPHPQTIRDSHNSVEADPGITKASFRALQCHAEDNNRQGKDTICALMMDEMSIRKQTEFVC